MFFSPTSSPSDLSILIAAGFSVWTLRTPSIAAIFCADKCMSTSLLIHGSSRSNGSKRSNREKPQRQHKRTCSYPPKRLERLELLERLERVSHRSKTVRRSPPALAAFRAGYGDRLLRLGRFARWEK